MLTCVFVVLGAGLLLAPAQALAATDAGHAPFGARHATAPGVDFQRLGDTTYSISGHVLDYAGNPVAGAEVDWGWWSSMSDYHFGGSNFSESAPYGTDGTGAFSFAGVTGGHGVGGRWADDLTISYNSTSLGLEQMEAEALDFAANNNATPFSYEMQPAEVNVDIAHAPTATWAEATAGNGNVGYARSDVPLTAGAGVASVLPMTNFDDVVASFPIGNSTAEIEWLGTPVSVNAGTTATATVDLDWDNAQYAYLAGPSCQHSGKPGTTVRMILKGWPAGEKAEFVGSYGATPVAYPQFQTSSGAGDTYAVPLQIRTNAPVGLFQIDTHRADNTDSLIDISNTFQVCTFKSSASAIHHGQAIRLSGKVFGLGDITIYSTGHKVSSQPWTLAAKGWVRRGSYRISAWGKFLTGPLRPHARHPT